MIDYDKHIADAIHIFDLAEINLKEISKADRSRTLNLELQMTAAANREDTEKFFGFLEEWRCILLSGEEEERFHQRVAA